MSSKKIIYGISATVLLLILLQAFFIVAQWQQALVFQFGKVVEVIKEPGLQLKIPFLQDVVYFDNRLLNITAEEKEFTAKDQKRIIINAFAKYKIKDPLKFYQSVRDEQGIKNKINAILDSSMRQIVGKEPLSALLTEKRATMMQEIQAIVNEKAQTFGVDVTDVRISRADLPSENSEAIYKRMQTEREREAKEFRAEGAEEAQRITAKAEKDRVILIAQANKEAQMTKAEGDSKAAKIYNDAFTRDPEFYAFYRSLLAYKKALKGENTSIVISPDHEFFKYMKKQ